jgi:hypothetical protein
MGLIMKTPIQSGIGIEINNASIRIIPMLDVAGTWIKTANLVYVSKEAYTVGGQNIQANAIPLNLDFEYDRAANGTDILTYALEQVAAYLCRLNNWQPEQIDTEPTE